ncbi:MAG TPA: hypothetical protein VFG21_06665 [Xanthomonadaceae bacterium]|nr:hypothetical protein [Xanthomonadaceae bacterium]
MSGSSDRLAWRARLKAVAGRPGPLAALASWGIAVFEYLLAAVFLVLPDRSGA